MKLWFLRCLAGFIGVSGAGTALSDEARSPVLHNGGAAYFQLKKGPFKLNLFKRDLKKLGSHWDTDRKLTAQLFDPSGECLAVLELPDAGRLGYGDGGWSPPWSGEINVEIEQAGIHVLVVTVRRNSYFSSVLWGFDTNAEKFMIDAGGGHVDTARIEKISLLRGWDLLEVVFKPRNEIYSFSVQNLSPGVESIEVRAGEDKVRKLGVCEGGVNTILKKKDDQRLLSIRLGDSISATVQAEGVTTWQKNQNPRLPLWTTRRSAWFDVEKTRWVLWPRYQKIFADGKGKVRAEVLVRNVLKEPMDVLLTIDGGGIVPDQTIEKKLQAGETCLVPFDLNDIAASAKVTVCASVPNAPDVYATVEVCPEGADDEALSLPFTMPAFRHNSEAFGLQEDRKVGIRVLGELVDRDGREWRVGTHGIFVREGGSWKCVLAAGTPEFGTPYIAGPNTQSMLAVDEQGRIYSLFRRDRRYLLIAVDGVDGPFHSMELPATAIGRVVLPPMATTEPLKNPPVLLMYKTLGPKISFWSANNSFTAFVPQWEAGVLKLESEIVLAENCLAHCMSVAEYNPPAQGDDEGRVDYIAVYGVTSPAVDGKPSKDPGVPVYVRTFNREGMRLGDPMLIGYAPPKNDSHNAPSVLMDSKGYCHVILGGHNTSFLYTRSEASWEIGSWLSLVKVAPDYAQTYVHAVVGKDDTIHLVSRIWRRGLHFPNDEFDTALIYQRKKLDEPWTTPKVMVTPPLEHYSHYYHRLTIAPSGRLCLAWTNWSTWSAYRNELLTLGPPGDSSFGYLYMVSDDHGETWKFYRGATEACSNSIGEKQCQ